VSNLRLNFEAKELGIPSYSSGLDLTGKMCAWLPGMKTDQYDWHFITWHTGDINRYKLAGGDPERMIIHHLTYDSGIIDPLWGTETFKKRCDRMREFGVKYIVAPDFSAWADMPLVLQLYNTYKSAVVAVDLIKAGFEVVAHTYWSAPQIHGVQLSTVSAAKMVLVDACHIKTGLSDFNAQMFWAGAKEMISRLPDVRVLLWCAADVTMQEWKARIGENVQWVPSRTRMLRELTKPRRK